MKTKFALNEAIQVGPWRVARKHLLFVILFGLSIITFGVIILQTHVFDNEEDEDEEGDEEGDEEWDESKKGFSSGDWVMVAIMVAAGLLSLAAVFVCLLVKKNSPRRLSATPRRASIYSVQFNSDATKSSLPQQQSFGAPQQQSFGAPQQLPIWSGQLIQPQQIPEHPQATCQPQPIPQTILSLPQILRQQPIQEESIIHDQHVQQNSPISSPHVPTHYSSRKDKKPSRASAPQFEENHPPPPYSP